MDEEACKKGSAARCTVGFIYVLADRIPEGLQLLQSGCDGGAAEVCDLLANVYSRLKNFEQAHPAALKACELGYMQGCAHYATFWVDVDNSKAVKYAKKSCAGGEKIGCSLVSEIEKYLSKKTSSQTPERKISSARSPEFKNRIQFYEACISELKKTRETVDPVEDCKGWVPSSSK